MSISGVPVVGAPVPLPSSPDGGGTVIASNAPLPDFGPAAVFTPSTFDAAALLNLYNRAGVAVPLTHWLRSGEAPILAEHISTDAV